MAGNEFLLPDELGWEANDEIKKRTRQLLDSIPLIPERHDEESLSDMERNNRFNSVLDVYIAEYMDDIYAIIKKYQEKK